MGPMRARAMGRIIDGATLLMDFVLKAPKA
jgi:hypothetical protein